MVIDYSVDVPDIARLTNPRTGWRVDFNVSLRSFEPLIAGSRNLLDLALNSPLPGGPRVVFVSSAGVLRSVYSYASRAQRIPC